MSAKKEGAILVYLGNARKKKLKDVIAAQGLTRDEIVVAAVAARRFAHLTPEETTLPKERRDAIQQARRDESKRILALCEELEKITPRRTTFKDIAIEAIDKWLADHPPKPATKYTAADLQPKLTVR